MRSPPRRPASFRRKASAILAVCLAYLTVVDLLGQETTASLSGIIRDSSRAVVTDATVIVTSRATSLIRKTASDAGGRFQLTALAPGAYNVTIERTGFNRLSVEVTLLLGENRSLDLTLVLEGFRDAVDVHANEAVIDSSATAIGRRISGKEASDLPVQGRLFLELAKLTPGILSSYNTAATGSGFSSAGQTGRNNSLLVDGLGLDEVNSSSPRGGLPLDAIRDFVVVSNAPTAEFGQASGAIVNVLTKSGTNTYRGLGFVYGQNGGWNATPGEVLLAPTARPKPDFNQTITGGSLGGPISRNHAFFFSSLEHTAWNSEFIVTSPVAGKLAPNEPLSMPQQSRQPQVLGRADVNLPKSSTLTARYRLDRTAMKGRMGVADMDYGTPSRGHDSLRHDDDLALASTIVLASTLLNELHVQRAGRRIEFDPTGYCAGCPSIEYPLLLLGKNPGVPNGRVEERWQAVDAVTFQRSRWLGDHTFKAGLDMSFIGVDFNQLGNRDGTFRFHDNVPFDQNDGKTYPVQYTRTVGDPFVHVDDTIAASFVQDRWVPGSGITVNLGVRWDYERTIGVAGDKNNVAPRIGVAVDPWRTGKASIRASYGFYYDQVFLTIARTGLQALTASSFTITNPGFQGDHEHKDDPFGFNPNPAKSSQLVNTTRLSDLVTPYTEQTSIGFQRALGSTTSLSIDGVWARGRHLLVTRDLNYPDLDHPHADGSPPSRPDPNFGKISSVESTANSWYRGVQIGLLKSSSSGFGYSIAYTLSSSQRDTEDFDFVPQDQRDYGADRAPSLNDARHRLAGTLICNLPFRLRFASIVTFRSALPYNITLAGDENRDGNLNDRPFGQGRNSARGASFVETDLRVTRTFGRHARRIELIGELFNVTNRRNWIFPSNIPFGSPRRPSGAEIPRQVQLGLRVLF